MTARRASGPSRKGDGRGASSGDREARADISIVVSADAGGWPAETALQTLCQNAIGAALASIRIGLPDRRPRASEEGMDRRLPPFNRVCEVSILFTSDAAVRELNRTWRGKDRPTNVLSFPQPDGPLLGDIVLAAKTVAAEAALAGKAIEDHIAHLVVHGFLHLLGYDHADDAEAENMEMLEGVALKRLGIPNPYGPLKAHE